MRIPLVAAVLVCALMMFGALLSTGLVYQTGANWYSDCWHKLHEDRKPSSPEEAAAWATCESAADTALFGAGLIYAGNPKYAVSTQLKAIQAACPNAYSEIPLSGPYSLIVESVQNGGGPRLIDRLMPAHLMIERVLHSKWPNCSAAREANGFPRMIRNGAGWAFQSPCLPCEAETNAMKKEADEQAIWQAKWEHMTQAERDAVQDKEIDEAFGASAAN